MAAGGQVAEGRADVHFGSAFSAGDTRGAELRRVTTQPSAVVGARLRPATASSPSGAAVALTSGARPSPARSVRRTMSALACLDRAGTACAPVMIQLRAVLGRDPA